MTQSHARPEDRRRSGIDSQFEQSWADTHPDCFRSEGFAEDLQEMGPAPVAARAGRGWGLRRPGGALPLLGVALAGVLGAFAR
jgi:hypothetical protein